MYSAIVWHFLVALPSFDIKVPCVNSAQTTMASQPERYPVIDDAEVALAEVALAPVLMKDLKMLALCDLHLDFDQCPELRNHMRVHSRLLKWPSAKTTGIPSMTAVGLNHVALVVLGRKWCPQFPEPATVAIDPLRDEVVELYKLHGLGEDLVGIAVDCTGLKRLFNLAVRRLDQGKKKGHRDSCLCL
jgi:hypothetical protein